jgi:hypothetical protein
MEFSSVGLLHRKRSEGKGQNIGGNESQRDVKRERYQKCNRKAVKEEIMERVCLEAKY